MLQELDFKLILDVNGTYKETASHELDVRTLKPVLEASTQSEELKNALSEIASQGLEYKT